MTTKPNIDHQPHHGSEGVNPILAIATAIAIALIISGFSLLLFLRSDTRQTVKLIQDQAKNTSAQELAGAFDGLDTTSRPTEADLDEIQQTIQTAIDQLDNETDFNPAVLTDSALGL